jgi:hypothetical protein
MVALVDTRTEKAGVPATEKSKLTARGTVALPDVPVGPGIRATSGGCTTVTCSDTAAVGYLTGSPGTMDAQPVCARVSATVHRYHQHGHQGLTLQPAVQDASEALAPGGGSATYRFG